MVIAGCETTDKVKARLREQKIAEPVSVVCLRATNGSRRSEVCYVGTVESSASATVSSRAAGTLVSIAAREGQRVQEGQTIATIDSQHARSAYDAAKSALDQAEDGWSRVSSVYATGTVTEAKYIEVRTKLEQARASEAAARKSLEDCTVKAPFSGIVDKIYLSCGVEVNPGEAILNIVDLRNPEVHFPLPENEFSSLREGDTATVSIPAIGRSLKARLASKGVTASHLSHSYDCILALGGNTSGVMPGMVCKVYFESGGGGRRVIPSSAVMTDMVGRYVWTVSPDSIVGRKYVKVSGYSGKGVVISYGLDTTDLVIIDGSRKVSTGMKVKVLE